MQIVIDIPEEDYNYIKKQVADGITNPIKMCIVNGTPLPKGHGDLIDKSKIHKAIPAEDDNITGMGMTYDEMNAYNDGIDSMYSLVENAKPIIEADGSDSE